MATKTIVHGMLQALMEAARGLNTESSAILPAYFCMIIMMRHPEYAQALMKEIEGHFQSSISGNRKEAVELFKITVDQLVEKYPFHIVTELED